MHPSLIKSLAVVGQMGTCAIASLQHAHSHQILESRAVYYPPGIYQGCFTAMPDSVVTQGAYSAQSSGYCNSKCTSTSAIYLTYSSDNCACADELPAAASQVDDSLCSGQCLGWPQDTCGSASNPQVFSVYLATDHKLPVQGESISSSSSAPTVPSSTTISTSSSTSVATVVGGSTTVTQPGTTFISPTTKLIYTTPPASTSTPLDGASGGGSSTNPTLAIALGVVGGVVVLIGATVALLFYIRSRRRKINADNTHRRAESLNAFVASGATLPGVARKVSVTDSRLDPRIMVEQRRESTGSVFADNQDYSRRILKIANPDGL